MRDLQELAQVIESNRQNGVDFGSAEDAPSSEWLTKAEDRLGKALPPSYK